MEFILKSETELSNIANYILKELKGRKKILLTGSLGAGKTTLAQHLCKAIGVKDTVNSPTFSIVNEYPFKNDKGATKWVHHIDLYRLNTLQEALDIGIEEYLYDDEYCLIEWPQLIEPLWPDDCVQISIDIIEDSVRKIVIL